LKNIQIDRTKKSPEVNIQAEKCIASFIGRSIHSDAFTFYDPIIKWFENYDQDSIKIDFIFDHINTITNKCILQILLSLKTKVEAGMEVSVCWHYDEEDEDMLETGEELEILSHIKFQYKHIS